jgi:hypothetical protein
MLSVPAHDTNMGVGANCALVIPHYYAFPGICLDGITVACACDAYSILRKNDTTIKQSVSLQGLARRYMLISI